LLVSRRLTAERNLFFPAMFIELPMSRFWPWTAARKLKLPAIRITSMPIRIPILVDSLDFDIFERIHPLTIRERFHSFQARTCYLPAFFKITGAPSIKITLVLGGATANIEIGCRQQVRRFCPFIFFEN